MIDYALKIYITVIIATFTASSIQSSKICADSDDNPSTCAALSFEEDALNAVTWPYYWRERYIKTLIAKKV